jgi:prepilin-type N-terminal cleavage/methylation domain-containing protein
MKRKTSGLTLPEIIIVIAIIVIVTAIVWLSIAPGMRARALEHSVRQDLSQIVVALRLYRDDYDGEWPNRLIDLPKEAPVLNMNWHRYFPNPYFRYSSERYNLDRDLPSRQAETLYKPKFPFDEDKDPIVSSHLSKSQVTWLPYEMPSACAEPLRLREWPCEQTLKAFADGRIGWERCNLSQWQFENNKCRMKFIGALTAKEIAELGKLENEALRIRGVFDK